MAKYQRVFNSLSISDGVIIKGHKIVIPQKLQTRILKAGHEGHQGIEKTNEYFDQKFGTQGSITISQRWFQTAGDAKLQ